VDRNAIRLSDLVTVAVVIAVIELNVAVGGGAGAMPLNAEAYVIGAVIALPLLVRRIWPLPVLGASFLLMVVFSAVDRRNISPAPLMFVPAYEAALAGSLFWAVSLPALIMVLGVYWVGVLGHLSAVVLAWEFLPSFAVFVLAVTLGEVVRSRRALAAETQRRLRIAEEERRAGAARLLAEERLRIARELHDTVAHSMATIAVQAGTALHLLGAPPGTPDGAPGGQLHQSLTAALTVIRATSKDALVEMRGVLGPLREDGAASPTISGELGLARAPGLVDAVTAAGSRVTLSRDGAERELPSAVDHVAYRILQESLTNVLRHTPAGTPAEVQLRYAPDALTVTVTDDGPPADGRADGRADAGPGHGIRGMRERTASVGGTLEAGPGPGGGFTVTATLPTAPALARA
jgi:signal transduction histidine kinase